MYSAAFFLFWFGNDWKNMAFGLEMHKKLLVFGLEMKINCIFALDFKWIRCVYTNCNQFLLLSPFLKWAQLLVMMNKSGEVLVFVFLKTSVKEKF
jgi:hypothetical protein